jgi:Zn-dependent peptidase ImmA (M78 family)
MTILRRRAIETLTKRIRVFTKVSTPVDLLSVIELFNGKIQYECFEDDDIAGKIEKEGESFVITVNKEQSELRINFTIAHELGHLFLHMGYIIDKNKWDAIDEYIDSAKYRLGYSEEEYEANQFAASFLMPAEEYKEFVRLSAVNNKIPIDKISSHFNVSHDAALTRGRWLGIFAWE